jgi:hypothetical protein
MKTLHEIEEAIETLPLADRLRLYKDMPQLIGRDVVLSVVCIPTTLPLCARLATIDSYDYCTIARVIF